VFKFSDFEYDDSLHGHEAFELTEFPQLRRATRVLFWKSVRAFPLTDIECEPAPAI